MFLAVSACFRISQCNFNNCRMIFRSYGMTRTSEWRRSCTSAHTVEKHSWQDSENNLWRGKTFAFRERCFGIIELVRNELVKKRKERKAGVSISFLAQSGGNDFTTAGCPVVISPWARSKTIEKLRATWTEGKRATWRWERLHERRIMKSSHGCQTRRVEKIYKRQPLVSKAQSHWLSSRGSREQELRLDQTIGHVFEAYSALLRVGSREQTRGRVGWTMSDERAGRTVSDQRRPRDGHTFVMRII